MPAVACTDVHLSNLASTDERTLPVPVQVYANGSSPALTDPRLHPALMFSVLVNRPSWVTTARKASFAQAIRDRFKSGARRKTYMLPSKIRRAALPCTENG